ncbi:MAG: glycoside hydrolase family 13 protein [Turicibacter sp.]
MERKWWKEAVGYQIYPKSFKDTNGDGIGDIRGIIEKLDYFNLLGVNLLWLCPVYTSPMDDNGYDVSDYYNIASDFGTLDDAKELLAEAKKRGIRIVMDLVLNHTSDEHPWFVEARSSKENKYRDYYVWQEGKKNEAGEEVEPTNWSSFFTPSCWDKDELTDEYYMHIFSKKMPDLNWSNESMRQELYDMVKWWLDLGIDGFRVDAIAHIEKDWTFEDSTLEEDGKYKKDWKKFSNLPKVHTYLKEFNQEVLSKYDIFTVGEVGGGAGVEDALKYAANDSNELDMVFTFDHCWLNEGFDSLEETWENKLDLVGLKKVFAKWQTGLMGKAWNPLYWLNHDHPRVMSQYGNASKYHKESGKMLANSLLFMWGTPFIYNGEEIGMTNANYTDFNDYRDVATHELVNLLLEQGHDEGLVRRHIGVTSRDNARTPMQWDSSENAGFSTAMPWIKVNENYKEINVAKQISDEDSLFNHYRQVIALRREGEYKDVIVYGDYELLCADDESIYAYSRSFEGKKIVIVSNFFDRMATIQLPEMKIKKMIISNYPAQEIKEQTLVLRPYESMVFEII